MSDGNIKNKRAQENPLSSSTSAFNPCAGPKDLSACELLKHKTDEIHNRLHHHPALSKLLTPAVTLHDVERCLARFKNFYNIYKVHWQTLSDDACKKTLAKWMSPHLQWLEQDLIMLGNLGIRSGISDTHAETARFSDRNFDPSQIDFNDSSAVWGYLYVTEGSLMGGSVIARVLAKHLYLKNTEEHGPLPSAESLTTSDIQFSYFNGYGAQQNHEHWQKVKNAMNSAMADASEQAMQRMVVAARSVFLTIEMVFDR